MTCSEFNRERGFVVHYNLIVDKSFSFAVRVVNLYKYLKSEKREFVLSKQTLRSGTSIGANVREAIYGQSRKDFISKMNIALKEAYESEYWLELLMATGFFEQNHANDLLDDCIAIRKILSSIVKSSKNS